MFNCFIKWVQFSQWKSQKEMTFDQILIHIQCPSTILASRLELFHLDVTQCTICKVSWVVRILDLEITTIKLDRESYKCQVNLNYWKMSNGDLFLRCKIDKSIVFSLSTSISQISWLPHVWFLLHKCQILMSIQKIWVKILKILNLLKMIDGAKWRKEKNWSFQTYNCLRVAGNCIVELSRWK